MFYEAAAKDDSRTIGVAVSKDGLKGWKCLDAPVLTASANASWDSGNVGAPCAVSMEGGVSELPTFIFLKLVQITQSNNKVSTRRSC